MSELDLLWADIQRPDIWMEFAGLALALGAGWLVAALLGRGRPAGEDSVWFGRRVVDGLLFPALALVFSFIARAAVGHLQHTLSVLKVAVPVLVSLVAIRLIARVFAEVFPSSAMARLTERVLSWVAWVGAVLWIVGLLPLIVEELEAISFSMGKSRISVWTLIEGTFSSALVLVIALWVSAFVERRLLRDAVQDLSLRKIAVNATRAVLLLLGLLFALSAVGVDLTALSVLGGALGVGLGFGLQKLAANYVSGFVILAERSLRIGDMVQVDGFEGRVRDIKTRYTVIVAPNGREAIVPNEKLITERIENMSLTDTRIVINQDLSVAYGTDVPAVQTLLADAAARHPRVLAEPAPAVLLMGFGADGLDLRLSYWIRDPENGQGNVRSDINLAVLAALQQAGVEIPYPQRVVHTVSS